VTFNGGAGEIMRPGYRQFCAVARTLDLVGARWTLLVVRELALRGPLSAAAIGRGLPDVPMNQLVQRLAELEAAGLATCQEEHGWELTDAGRRLEDVVGALARFGLEQLADGGAEDDDAVLPHVLMRQLELRYTLAGGGISGRFELEVRDPERMWSVEPGHPATNRFALIARPEGLTARAGAGLDADATLRVSVSGCTALVAGRRPDDVDVEGDAALAASLLGVLAPERAGASVAAAA
jgi:DNA-binding HxlR family transcriptional regulator